MVWSTAPVVLTPGPRSTRPVLVRTPSEAGRERFEACTVEVVRTPTGLAALKPAYDKLNAVCKNTLPFALHEWHEAWWNHFAKTEGKIRDELRIQVVRDHLGECVAIVPFISTQREIGVFKTETLALLGADPNFTELRSSLVTPGREKPVARAISRHLQFDDSWDWVQWSGVQGCFGEELAKGGALTWQAPRLDYLVDLAPTWDAFKAGLKRNIRESLRHCYNSLKRENLEFRMAVIEAPADVESALQKFFELHAMRASLEDTIMHHNHFAPQSARRFLMDVCKRFAEGGVLRIFQMYVGEHLVATRIGFQVADSLYTYYSGFDPAWRKYSVMTTTVTEMIKYAIEHGLKTVNLSPTQDVAKTRWGPQILSILQAVQVRHSVMSQLAWAGYRRAKSAGKLPGLLRRLSSGARKEWT
ncbi:MAG TPA: GNAT family N-acetyltransferase [Polyangiaceae bacterium]|nr:GNAT family N-acetyltransferase [Polyangiaceae bacterium]